MTAVRRAVWVAAVLTILFLTSAPPRSQGTWEFTGPEVPVSRADLDAAVTAGVKRLLEAPGLAIRETVTYGRAFGDVLGYASWTVWRPDGSLFRAEENPAAAGETDSRETEVSYFLVTADGHMFAADVAEGVWRLVSDGMAMWEPPTIAPLTQMAAHLRATPEGAPTIDRYAASSRQTSDFARVWFLKSPAEPFEVRTFAMAPEGHLRMFTIKYASADTLRFGVGTDLPSGIEVRYFPLKETPEFPPVSDGSVFSVDGFELPPDFAG